MNFQAFDKEYIQRLTDGDPGVESHFSAYFGELLYVKLRARLRSWQLIEDIRQETLLRVLEKLRKKDGVEYPERFGAFVNAVCNHVQLEMCRSEGRMNAFDENVREPTDSHADLDAPLIRADTKRHVHRVLSEMPEKDRELLRAYYLEEREKNEICRKLGVDREYLRVLLHRAKSRFRRTYESGVETK